MAAAEGWTEVFDPRSGRKYYANRTTGESSWTPPVGTGSDLRLQPPAISSLKARDRGTAGVSRTPPALSELTTRKASAASPRVDSATGPVDAMPRHAPPPLATIAPSSRGRAAQMETQSVRQSNPLQRRLSADMEQSDQSDSKNELESGACCLCGFSRRRNCCVCCWSVFLVLVGLLVFLFWPRASRPYTSSTDPLNDARLYPYQ